MRLDLITAPTSGPAVAAVFDGTDMAIHDVLLPFGNLAGGIFVG